MSFPNSGTSYTGSLMKAVSDRTTATNYGKEGMFSDEVGSIPLRSDSPSGPYIAKSPDGMPTTYVQTKILCGGRCGMCSPSKYIKTLDSFEKCVVRGIILFVRRRKKK
uniref:Uncharacterized protein n=1 Tax=Proboscia inermis TaxID=420281 RepID=A0A7S0GDI1_9STRA|mmetsp:Transcript_277/g.280  ORF Transcript_277/g.280 Transcript_277/m.280 type:complete len:108 (+) Transcript_277:165-488(+)